MRGGERRAPDRPGSSDRTSCAMRRCADGGRRPCEAAALLATAADEARSPVAPLRQQRATGAPRSLAGAYRLSRTPCQAIADQLWRTLEGEGGDYPARRLPPWQHAARRWQRSGIDPVQVPWRKRQPEWEVRDGHLVRTRRGDLADAAQEDALDARSARPRVGRVRRDDSRLARHQRLRADDRLRRLHASPRASSSSAPRSPRGARRSAGGWLSAACSGSPSAWWSSPGPASRRSRCCT